MMAPALFQSPNVTISRSSSITGRFFGSKPFGHFIDFSSGAHYSTKVDDAQPIHASARMTCRRRRPITEPHSTPLGVWCGR